MGFRSPVVGRDRPSTGRSLVGLRPFRIARLGIGFAPEESEVFGELTVAENIAMPTWTRRRAPVGRASASPRPTRSSPSSSATASAAAQALSGGERKMVSIARALALDPQLLLLDEPTEGLSPAIVPSIVEGLAYIRAFGHAVFIAESNIHHVPDFADRLYVIERGEIIFAGTPAEARRNPAVARVIEGTRAARRP